MELLDGQDLTHCCKKGHLLPLKRVLNIVSSVAEALGYAASVLGDPDHPNRELAGYQKVTAEDVQRVVREYMADDARTVVTMLPEAMRPGGDLTWTSAMKKFQW